MNRNPFLPGHYDRTNQLLVKKFEDDKQGLLEELSDLESEAALANNLARAHYYSSWQQRIWEMTA